MGSTGQGRNWPVEIELARLVLSTGLTTIAFCADTAPTGAVSPSPPDHDNAPAPAPPNAAHFAYACRARAARRPALGAHRL